MSPNRSLSDEHVRLLRLRAQRLAPPSPSSSVVASVMQVVKKVCGIQAQEAPAATLAVRVRSTGLVAADVERARVEERTVTRTWGLRGTLHLLATEDLGWLLPLLGPVFVAGARRRREELGLDEDTCVRGIHIISNILANQGPLTRAELFEQLAAHGLLLEGQARPHLLGRAALEGIICLGPDHGSEPTYVLMSDWVDQERIGHSFSETAAHAELTRRYLGAYGPATPEDQATWSGMPLKSTRAAWQHIADQLMEVEVTSAPAWMLKSRAAWLDDELAIYPPIVRLLPRFDSYLLGYQQRDLAVAPQYAKRINAGGGIIHPTVMVDGRLVGIWKSTRRSSHLDVMVQPFDQLAPQVFQGLETEITDLSRFLGMPTTLHVLF
ncbi:MAG: winged helix DNA-binding domain-containing protein [Ktedonobacteraceae bacterium]